MNHRIILSLCDRSGEWPRPYREAGYTVIQVDIQHGQDVRLLPYAGRVHGILAAPPCTVFAASGARWKRSDDDLRNALAVVDACLRCVAVCRPRWWALENPIGKLNRWLGLPSFRFDPCDYGDPYTKRTNLWGDFTPPLPLMIGGDQSVPPTEGSKMHRMSSSAKATRSVTPAGFARAFFTANP